MFKFIAKEYLQSTETLQLFTIILFKTEGGFFGFFGLSGFRNEAQNKESLIDRLYSVLNWCQLVMISGLYSTGGKLQCRGLGPLYEGFEHGGSEGFKQPAGVSSGL